MTARRLCGVLLGAAVAAGPAGALEDLTGTYSGPLVCDSTTDTDNARTKDDTSVYVTDDGAGNAYLYLNNSLQVFRTAVVSTPERPDQGRVGGPACSISPLTGGWLVQAVVKAKGEKASLKGEFLIVGVGAAAHSVTVCRFSMKRTSTEDPGVACP